LGRSSAREDDGAFVVEGATLLAEAEAAGWTIEAAFVAPGATVEISGAPVHQLAPGVLERVATTEHPQPVMAVVRRRRWDLADLARGTFVIVLAGVSDPGNAGTILRSAEAAGADGAIATIGTVDLTNPKVVRASAGSLFRLPTVEGVAPAALARLGLAVLGADASGAPYTTACFTDPVAIVLGNEAHGLPADLPLDGVVGIPHAGRAESLNVAMAATVLSFEVARQRALAR
jgi:RNA methyltransferase, TrmH family